MSSLIWGRVLTFTLPMASLRYWVLMAVYLLAAPVTVYIALYSPIPAVHDALHHVRHSFLNVACH